MLECLPDHVEHLRGKFGDTENVNLINKAAWNKKDTLVFYIGKTPGSSTAVVDAKGQRGQDLATEQSEKIEVEADTLTAIWKDQLKSKYINFLKMDIEGAEYEALEGAEEMLKCTERVAIAAYHIRDGVPTAKKVEEILRHYGFSTRIDANLHVYGSRLN